MNAPNKVAQHHFCVREFIEILRFRTAIPGLTTLRSSARHSIEEADHRGC